MLQVNVVNTQGVINGQIVVIKVKIAGFVLITKLDGMVNVVSKRCLHPECDKQPSYGYEGSSAPLKGRKFCASHKLEGMVDVIGKHCEYSPPTKATGRNSDGEYSPPAKTTGRNQKKCNKRSSYGYKGEIAKFCASHKMKGMINVVSKRCAHQGCDKHPFYGYIGKGCKFCADHKMEGMINAKYKHRRRLTKRISGGKIDSTLKTK